MVSFHPETESFPFFASNPRAIFPLNFSHACLRKSGSFIAALPSITLSMDLIPPPISIEIFNFFIIFYIIFKLTSLPVSAPSKSTMCKFKRPASLYFKA